MYQYTVYHSLLLFYCWQIFSRQLTDWLCNTVASNNRSRRLETLPLHKSLHQQQMRKSIRLSLMLSTVTSKGLRESTIFTPMSHLLPLRTNTKTLALLHIPNYNEGTDVHAVALSDDFLGLSEEGEALTFLPRCMECSLAMRIQSVCLSICLSNA